MHLNTSVILLGPIKSDSTAVGKPKKLLLSTHTFIFFASIQNRIFQHQASRAPSIDAGTGIRKKHSKHTSLGLGVELTENGITRSEK